ncbi:unnamed protein product [Caenorhabditis angaria]|uniref:Uncharacterized protein n=1 Tax=Caenorhabditis angaria TaxID=860376 RepID=A0A9P1J2X8_9PELO|nr:unnamed protein product [Caenorhabditis angaria]
MLKFFTPHHKNDLIIRNYIRMEENVLKSPAFLNYEVSRTFSLFHRFLCFEVVEMSEAKLAEIEKTQCKGDGLRKTLLIGNLVESIENNGYDFNEFLVDRYSRKNLYLQRFNEIRGVRNSNLWDAISDDLENSFNQVDLSDDDE